MFSQLRRFGGNVSLTALVLALGVWSLGGASAFAHGGGGGGGHGGGGGFGGGHMGGMGMGGHMGGMGGYGGHMGGMGGYGGYGGLGNRGFGYGGYGGFYPGFYGGGLGYGYGLGYGLLGYGGYGLGLGYGGYGLGYGGYGLGYGGYGGYGLGYGGYGGLGYGGYGGLGYGGYGGYPGYGYASYGYPYSTYGLMPANSFGYSAAYVAPTSGAATSTTQRRYLGIDEEPMVGSDGSKAMKVTNVYPGTAAEKAGLKAGDVLRSVNGYLTEQRGNLAWIIANAAPNNELKLNVRTAKDGQLHQIVATLP